MEETRNTRIMANIQIINALIWATIILISNYIFKRFDNHEVVSYTLVIGAGLQLSLMGYVSNRFFAKKSYTSQMDKTCKIN